MRITLKYDDLLLYVPQVSIATVSNQTNYTTRNNTFMSENC